MITREQFAKDFELFVDSMRDILIKKNHDYTGASDDPLYNLRKAEDMGIPSWKGALLRFSDKFSRLCTFSKKELFQVDDENFDDTLRDAANYLFLISELYKESKNDQANKESKNINRPQSASGLSNNAG